MNIHHFFDKQTSTFSYIVFDEMNEAIVIDPVLNFDSKSGVIKDDSLNEILNYLQNHNLTLKYILETHAHADHLSSSQFLKEKTGAKILIDANIKEVQSIFSEVFNMKDFNSHIYFDEYVQDGTKLKVGNFEIEVIGLPGHTPACVGYKIDNNIFVGDTIFMPDVGSARCDFPGGSAETLYDSVQKLLSYPDDTNLFMCHDYPKGRDIVWKTTVQEQKKNNIHLNQGVDKLKFIEMRTQRDKTLEMPNLLFPSLQVNIKAGQLPAKEDNGTIYFKIPLSLPKNE